MKFKRAYPFLNFLLFLVLSLAPFDFAYAIVDGANALDVLGQRNGDGSANYTKNKPNNGPDVQGLNFPHESTMDTVNHRLFVSDYNNHRVLVFNLNNSNQLVDYTADFVLGQADFTSGANATAQNRLRTYP